MSDDLVSLKFAVVSEAAAERELVRQAASMASVPIETIEVAEPADTAAVCELLARESLDVVFLDSRMPKPDRQAAIDAARAAKSGPFVILIGAADIKTRQVLTDGLPVDGVLAKPIDAVEARALVDGCVRARIPSRVLVVDDSSTVRSVVRKVLAASRFRLESDEAEEGGAALERVRDQHFDIMFLDCHMPGLDGWGTLAELQRTHPQIQVVMITGTNDERIADKARAAGAKDLLFKPFYAKDIDAVLNRLFGLMPAKAS